MIDDYWVAQKSFHVPNRVMVFITSIKMKVIIKTKYLC